MNINIKNNLNKITYASLLLFACLAQMANAGLIQGDYQTADGKKVNLSGQSWLTWETSGISRIEMENIMLPGEKYENYRYATRAEFEALFDSLWGGVENWSSANKDGGNWLHKNFGSSTVFDGKQGGFQLFFGNDTECHALAQFSCRASYRSAINGATGTAIGSIGWFSSNLGVSTLGKESSTNINSNAVIAKTTFGEEWTHALIFKQPTQLRSFASVPTLVPEPNTLMLLVYALLVLSLGSLRKFIWLRHATI